ncbi:MAG: FAD:protein FMN transferase [Firmicutes bacterium]|nr:FAD:protein FMN transferase [Bacillota bacterium]
MAKKVTAFLILLSMLAALLSGCRKNTRYSVDYYDVFDTFSTFTCYGLEEEAFDRIQKELHQLLLSFHQETDIYHTYEDVHSLKELNDQAGNGAISLSRRQYDFLLFCKNAYTLSEGRVNVMLGAVTRLWHEARERAGEGEKHVVPSKDVLEEAFAHTSPDLLELDEDLLQASITDPLASIDVGALAKGYAGSLAMDYLASQGVENYLLNLGGNVCAHGKPLGTGRDAFLIGLQSPNEPDGSYSQTVTLEKGCAVTSGDYQRFFEEDGIRYNHIIDPDTLYPAALHRSVTVLAEDPAIADLLSTALFLMDTQRGQALAASFDAEVIYQD